MTTTAYLERLGLPPDLPPTHETLVAVHRAHLEHVPYENLDIMLGRPPSVTPADSLERLGRGGRVGYCFHHNGALELVLRDLGFEVERRHGHVYTHAEHRWQTELTHLVLVVDGWWVDVGLGDGFYDPLPLTPGTHEQGGFAYRLEARGDGWSFHHDPAGTFAGIEVTRGVVDAPAVADAHRDLSTGEGHFTTRLVAQRRDAGGTDTVRGCLLLRVEPGVREETELTTYSSWHDALREITLVPLDDVPEDELRALFDRCRREHQQWVEAGRP